jgi:hypothetical protein
MTLSRRNFLKGGLAGAAALALTSRSKRARGGTSGQRVVVVGIGGGLRARESLGMAEGATFPNLFGTTPLISGYGTSAGTVNIAPEYAAMAAPLVLPAVRSQPLYTQGSLITNLRYADGPPGHLQGHGCLLSGYYNQIENRADAHLPVPTIFEIHRRATNAGAQDAWYISRVGGFYRALIASNHPDYGNKYAGIYLQPPGAMSPIMPIIASGQKKVNLTVQNPGLPIIASDAAEDAAVAKLTAALDTNSPPYADDDPIVHLSADDNAQVQAFLAEIYADSSYDAFFPKTYGIGMQKPDGSLDNTADALTVYHAERVLQRFRPSVMGITLLDIDVCHTDFNGYLRAQQLADALVSHLWDFIQSDPDLKDTTTLVVLPEHGRHLFFNGNNPDSLGRSGLDHGQGDNGDRDVWMLALGPGIKQNNVIAPTGIVQTGRGTDRYETIDVVMTAMSLLGHDAAMKSELVGYGARPGLIVQEVLR